MDIIQALSDSPEVDDTIRQWYEDNKDLTDKERAAFHEENAIALIRQRHGISRLIDEFADTVNELEVVKAINTELLKDVDQDRIDTLKTKYQNIITIPPTSGRYINLVTMLAAKRSKPLDPNKSYGLREVQKKTTSSKKK
jgi:hypothetical protein